MVVTSRKEISKEVYDRAVANNGRMTEDESERVPEERKKCLVTFKGGYVGIMYYASDLYRVDEYDFCDEKGMAGWYDYDRELGHYSRDDVIAWMPLPESYKAESEVDS